MPSIPEYKTSFYQMLPRLGIKMADRSQWDIQAVNSALDELGGYPAEWFPRLEAEAKRRGTENPMKILNVMSVSKAQNRPPDERPFQKQEAAKQRIDDVYIEQWAREKLEGSLCSHDEPCRASLYRESLKEMTG